MQQCWSISNVCILSVCTCTAGLLVGSVCLLMFECVFVGVCARRLSCDGVSLHVWVDVFRECVELDVDFFYNIFSVKVCVWVRSCGLGFTPVFVADWASSVFLHSLDFLWGRLSRTQWQLSCITCIS